MMNRRTLLVSATASAALAALGITPSVLAASRIKLGDAQPFGFDALIERARALAGKPYAPPPSPPTARSASAPTTRSLPVAPGSSRLPSFTSARTSARRCACT